jgi:hypothetical protein
VMRRGERSRSGDQKLFLSIFCQESFHSLVHGLRELVIRSELDSVPCDGFIQKNVSGERERDSGGEQNERRGPSRKFADQFSRWLR